MKTPKERKPLFERIKAGLEEAILHAEGKIALKTTVLELPDPPPAVEAEEVAQLRQDTRLSQADFAKLLNVSVKTVQSWEKGTRKPSQAALRLVQVLRHHPSGVFQVAGMSLPEERAISKRESRFATK